MSAEHPLDRRSALLCALGAGAAVLPLALLLPNPLAMTLLGLALFAALALWRGRLLPRPLRVLLTLAGLLLIAQQYQIGFGGGFGRDTGAALLAIMLMLKLLELRRIRDGRALLSFSLFSLMAAFLLDQGPLTLLLSLLGGLLVLAGLARLAEVESPDPRAQATPDLHARLGAVLRMAALSLPLAIAVFYFFPRLPGPLWALPRMADEARTGVSDTMSPGDIAKLYIDDSPVMRAYFDGPAPPPGALYWRGPVLSNFDGRTWTISYFNRIDPGEVLAQGPALDYQLEMEPTERRFVFALDLPLAAEGDYRLSFERSLIAPRRLNNVSRHTLRSQVDYRFQPTLPYTLRQSLTALPPGFNPRTTALAAQWRAEGANDEAVIQRALQWFNAEFTYSLEPTLLGRDSVDEFLFRTQLGYCEHFASAFVVLLRAAGIPARVVTGYQGGYVNPLGDYLVVRQSDAHAWAEVWQEGRGWLRIDPTSAVAPERIQRGVDALGAERRMLRGWGRALFNTADWLRRGWNDFVLGFDASRQTRMLRPFGIAKADWRQLGIGLLIAVGLALALTFAWMLRPPADDRDALGRAWARFLRTLARAGVAKAAHEGALDFGRRAAAHLPTSAATLEALSMRYARRRYAADASDPDDERELCRALREFRPAKEAMP
ncbi:MAG: DUF3488 and DUF4129 domain-containing transglutaminase family protein [Lysobacteraceae bacterium]